MRLSAMAVAASVLGMPPQVAAAGWPDPAAFEEVSAQTRLRVTTVEGQAVEGRFVEVVDGVIVLDDPPRRIALDTVTKIHRRGRAVWSGAVIGGLVLGGAMAYLVGGFASVYCEGTCNPSTEAVKGFGMGAGVGSVVGAAIGMAVPAWHRLKPARAPRGPRGTAALDLGYHRALSDRALDGGRGERLTLSLPLGAWSPGVELGRYRLGRRAATAWYGPIAHEESLLHGGPTVAFGRPRGGLRPYGVAGLGYYQWTQLDPLRLDGTWQPIARRKFLGGSVGGGLQVRAVETLSFRLEGRWHTSLSHPSGRVSEALPRRLNVMSLNAGASFTW